MIQETSAKEEQKPRDKQWHRILVIGPPGSGKTTLAGELGASQHIKRIALLDLEGKTISIRRGWSKIVRLPVPRPDMKNPSTGEPESIFKGLKSQMDRVCAYVKQGEIDCLIWDSVSYATQKAMDTIQSKRVSASLDKDTAPQVPMRDAYHTNTQYIGNVLRQITDQHFPCHVIVLCNRDEDVKGEGDKREVIYKPYLSSAIAQAAPSYFKDVWFTSIERRLVGNTMEMAYVVRCRPDAEHPTAKNCGNVLAPEYINTTMDQLWTILATYKPERD